MMIKLEKITKKYGKRHIFSDFSYEFPSTGLIGLVGASGSGKTTLLNMISGVDNDYDGTIKIEKTNLKKLSNKGLANYRIKNIGYIFQNFNLINLGTVFDNVSLPLETSFSSKKFLIRKRVKDSLNAVGLKNLSKQRVNRLSGGEKQRVAIARALINDPEIILCDEPTGALDEKNGKEVFNLLKSISQKRLVLIATHDLESISLVADSILKIEDGKVSTKKFKCKKVENNTSLIGKGREKKNPHVPLLFKIRYSFQKIRAKKYRSIIANLMLSLSLTGIGLSLMITDSVSTKVEHAFNEILNGNYLILSNTNDNENLFSAVYSSPYDSVEKIYNKYQYMLDGIGVNYLVNFEDFFKDGNEFFVNTETKRFQFNSLSARSINDFKFIEEDDSRFYYPYNVDLLDDDQVILGLSYEDMANLCFNLKIQRNFTSLGHYIYEKGLSLTLTVRNDYWQYDDDQLFSIAAVCESSQTCIYHTNILWNEVVFEEMMRLPSDDDQDHKFPWEMYKIYFLKTKEDPSIFMNSSQSDDMLFDYVLERTNNSYNPLICKKGEPCSEKRVYVYSVDKKGMYGSVIDRYRNLNPGFENFYYTSDYGYASYGSNLFSGFSKNIFVSLDESLIDEAIDADTGVTEESNVAINLPKGIIQGNYLMSLNNGLRFSTNFSKLIYGRKPTNINEIVISKGLQNELSKNTNLIGKYLEIAGEIEEKYGSDGSVTKEYNKTRLLIVGIVDESKNYIYHNSNWTIDFFRDKMGISSFYLIPRSIVFEFQTPKEADQAIVDLNSLGTGYKIISPIQEIKSNVDSTLEYANTILTVFSYLSSIISVLLLGTIMMLNILESKGDVSLFQTLGITRGDINSFFITQSVVHGLIAFFISAIELVAVDFVLSYLLGNQLNIGFSVSLNPKPILIILHVSFIVPILVSSVLLLILQRKH